MFDKWHRIIFLITIKILNFINFNFEIGMKGKRFRPAIWSKAFKKARKIPASKVYVAIYDNRSTVFEILPDFGCWPSKTLDELFIPPKP
jgi:hypothetical protein